MSPRRYIAVFFATTIAVLLGVAAFNAAVDPYAVFGSPRVERFNARKPAASSHTAMAKSHQIEAIAPRTVLLGTSRVDIGFDPEHPAWPVADRPVYNYGVPASSSIRMLEKQFRHAVSTGSVKRALIALEFHDFLNARVDQPDSMRAVARRFGDLSERKSARSMQLAADRFDAALSLMAVIDSGYTVLAQSSADRGDLSPHGLTSEAPYAVVSAKDGQYLLFRQKNLQMLPARRHAAKLLAERAVDDFAEIPLLRSLLQYAQLHGIELDLVIPPYHAHYYEIVDATGLWSRFEAWKAMLVKLVHEQRRDEGAVRITLWDFASYDAYTTEPVPREGDRSTQMQWFWEPAHFRKALGDLMLARILGGDTTAFGVELTPQTLPARLQEGRLQRTAYRARQAASERVDLARLMRTGTSPNDVP